MTYNHPYWLAKITNTSSIQWKSLTGENISGFIVSDHAMDIDGHSDFYGTNGVKNSYLYINLDLKVSRLSRRMSDVFFSSPIEDIPNLEISISRTWKDKYALTMVSDILEAFKVSTGSPYSRNSTFSLDQARIDLYFCNGAVPGWKLTNPSLWTWYPIDIAPTPVTWEPTSGYTIQDDYSKKFTGRIVSLSRDGSRYSIQCDSVLSSLDKMIDDKKNPAENSTSTIKPFCFGDTQKNDPAPGFPMLIEYGDITMRADTGSASRVIQFIGWRDEPTTELFKIVTPFRSENGVINFNADISGALLETDRLSTNPWRLSITEQEAMGMEDLQNLTNYRSQIIHESNGEKVAFHSAFPYGASGVPTVSSTLISFENSAPFESRGFDATVKSNQLAGVQYTDSQDKLYSIRVAALISIPVCDIVQTGLIFFNDSDRVFIGNTGDVELLRIDSKNKYTNDWTGGGSARIKVSNRGYGPITWGGVNQYAHSGVTFDSTKPISKTAMYLLRSQKPDFDTSNDEFVLADLRILATASIENPNVNSSISIEAVENPTSIATSGVVILQANNGTPIATRTGEQPFIFSPSSLGDFESMFESNRFAIRVNISSDYTVDGSNITYHHPTLTISKLSMEYGINTDARSKKLIWCGEASVDAPHTNIINTIDEVSGISGSFSGSVYTGRNHVGWISEPVILKDAIKAIAMNHSLIVRYLTDSIEVISQVRKNTADKVIVDDDIYLDNEGIIDMQITDGMASELYSGFVINYAKIAGTGDYAKQISITEKGFKSSVSNYFGSYTDGTWYYLTYGQRLNIKNLCDKAKSQNHNVDRILSINLDHVRTADQAERFLAMAAMYFASKRKTASLKGQLTSWIDSKIGDQVEFDLSSQYMDSNLYQSELEGTIKRRFMITSIDIGETGADAEISVGMSEIPYFSTIGKIYA